MLHRKLLVDEVPQRGIDDNRIEHEELDVQLSAERFAHALLGHQPEPDQHLAERLTRAALLGQRGLELLRTQLAASEEEIAELAAAPVALENRHQLIPRDDVLGDEDMSQGGISLVRGLHAQRLLELGRRDQIFGQQQFAEADGHDRLARRARL